MELNKQTGIIDSIIREFGIAAGETTIQPIHQGLINDSWKIGVNGQFYVLQRINHHVFKEPEAITHNIALIGDYLKQHKPGYLFTHPVESVNGKQIVHHHEEGYFRLFPFISNSHSIDVVQTPEQAYEAAKQFGKFTAVLSGFDAQQLKVTIPLFHDLSWRFKQFQHAINNGKQDRVNESDELIRFLLSMSGLVESFEAMKVNPAFKQRVTHHDTKISNVLFNDKGKGICVIDLDTVMPGYFISDVGDMMRTYLSPVSEEESDFSKIEVRTAYYEAIVEGYLSEMRDLLTEDEKQHFFYAGIYMTYMQALRFMTDYLNGDLYYSVAYPEQNKIRTMNQVVLLKKMDVKVS
jgi:Ser/Thr protein kinase RdoA (MazF antagonist)